MKTVLTKFFLAIFLVFLVIIPAFSVDYYELGKELYYKKNYQNAAQCFKKAINQNPLNTNYRYYYAQTLVYLGNFETAQSEYSKIIEISPNSEAANFSVVAISNIQKYYIAQSPNNTTFKSVTTGNILLSKSFHNDNYIENAVTTSGDIFLWNKNKLPINIYFINSKTQKGFNPEYAAQVQRAFDLWRKALKGSISYKYVYDKNIANILISFNESLSNNNDNKGYMAGLTKPYPGKEYLEKTTISLATLKPDGKPISKTAIYNCALHEIGHALGIWGHSNNKNDIMYATGDEKSNDITLQLSKRDINTINDLYSLTEQELLAGSEKEGNKSGMLGSKDERLQKKIKEALDYVKKVPNDPISWTQLGSTYLAVENYTDAIKNFEKALSLNPDYKNANEGLAQAYTSKNDVLKAEKYYKYLTKTYPKDKKQFYQFALLYIDNKQYDKAKSVLNRYISNDFSATHDQDIQSLFNIIKKASH